MPQQSFTKPWFVYIAHCSDSTYYTGISTDVKQRIKTHNLGRASLYTRGRLPLKLVYCESHPNKSAASKREVQLKKWTRRQKENLVK